MLETTVLKKQIPIQRFLVIAVVIALPFTCFPFYSLHERIFLVIGVLTLLGLTIKNAVWGLSLLIVGSIFFGNHPGGKYMEVYDFLLMIWVVVAEFKTRGSRVYAFIGGLEWLFLLSCLLSIAANPFLVKAMLHYHPHPFFVFTAAEDRPFYVLKMLIMTGVCVGASIVVYRLYLQKGVTVLNSLTMSMLVAAAIAIAVGILEAYVPEVRALLVQYRSIDKPYQTANPLPIPFLSWAQKPLLIRSLFWNRGWFAIFLIATFPFLMHVYHKQILEAKGIFRQVTLSAIFFSLLLYIFTLIAARGALVAFLFSAGFYIIHRIQPKIPHAIAYVVLGFVLVFPFVALINPEQTARSEFFQAGWAIGFANPLFGAGLEGFGWNNNASLRGSPFYASLNSSHNQMLQVFSGQGLLGVICYFSILVLFLKSLSKLSSERRLPWMTGFVAILIYSSVQEWFYLRPVQLYWWLLICCCLVSNQIGYAKSFFSLKKKRNWIGLYILMIGALAAGLLKESPKEFGLSLPEREGDQQWRWVTGKEGWYEIPQNTGEIRLALKNLRPENDQALSVRVEIPPIYRTTLTFENSSRMEDLTIHLPEGSTFENLVIKCDRSFSPAASFHSLDSRILCVFTRVTWIPLGNESSL